LFSVLLCQECYGESDVPEGHVGAEAEGSVVVDPLLYADE